MGVPDGMRPCREPAPSAARTASGRDQDRAQCTLGGERVRALRALELCGYVLKKDSPSCGIQRVKIYSAGHRGARARPLRRGVC